MWNEVFVTEKVPDMGRIRLRDPDKFIAGGIHRDPEAWEMILKDHPLAESITGWIRNGVNIKNFSQPFKDNYK